MYAEGNPAKHNMYHPWNDHEVAPKSFELHIDITPVYSNIRSDSCVGGDHE